MVIAAVGEINGKADHLHNMHAWRQDKTKNISHMVTADGLVKTYGKKKEVLAVDGVSFSVDKGEIFGLIGPDGAGKTSIFRMLTTLLVPDGGKGTVEGFDIVRDYRQIRSTVGYMPGRFSLYQDLTVEENLDFFATVFNTTVRENYALIKDIYDQIAPFKRRRAGALSGGMKQKLALCCALIHKPTVLFLDEPTTGVDPVSRKEFWEMLGRLSRQGITIVVATPYMDEAALCDRIALIQSGRILSVDTPAGISGAYPDQLLAVQADNRMSALLKALDKNNDVLNSYAFGEYAHVAVKKEESGMVGTLGSYLEKEGFGRTEIKPVQATVEDCFIQLLK
jgi:ABC-type multidrug transport system ATPase subunit